MKIKNLKLTLAFLITFISQAHASLLVEPVLGYNVASKVEFDGGDSYSGGRGVGWGGRLGYQKLGLQLGVDYLNSTIDMDDKDFAKDLKTSEWAGFVGFEFPILLRVYAGYIFSSIGESRYEVAGVDQKLDLKGGTGPKVGIGFTALPFLDINFEYRKVTFDDNKLGGAKMDDDVNYNTYFVGLSLPFNL